MAGARRRAPAAASTTVKPNSHRLRPRVPRVVRFTPAMPYEPRALRMARSLTAGAVILALLVAAGALIGSFNG